MKARNLVIIIAVVLLTAICCLAVRNGGIVITEQTAEKAVISGRVTKHRDTIPHLDTTSQTILLIGDSMAYTLMFRMQNYCSYNGHNLHVVSWVAASTKTYAECDTLSYFIRLYKPTYIIFVIGANELFAYQALKRVVYVNTITDQIEGIKTVWIGPPNWKPDTGINKMLMDRFGPKKFFLSKDLTFTRIKGDVAHPDRASGSMWVDSIADWIMNKSKYPIKLLPPDKNNPIRVDFVKLVLPKKCEKTK